MVKCSRLTQSCQLHLGTALQEDEECMWRWMPTCSLVEHERDCCWGSLGWLEKVSWYSGWRSVNHEIRAWNECCVGTWVGEEEAVLGLTWVEEAAGVGPPLVWCWVWPQCVAETGSSAPWHQDCMLDLPRSGMAAPWSERGQRLCWHLLSPLRAWGEGCWTRAWHRLPGQAVDAPSLEVSNNGLDVALCDSI